MVEPAQLDIFIPLQRHDRLREWASLAREHGVDVDGPGGVATFANWLRDNGHAPAGVSHEGLQLLVAVMQEWEGATAYPLRQSAS